MSIPRACLVVLALAPWARGDERLKDIACRSVHLAYVSEEARAFHNEVTVERSAPGTYFMVCGWKGGYFGIQELEKGRKQVIFSVWDASGTDDPQATPETDRVKLVFKDPAVRVARFGGEGTGGQSFLPFPWKAHTPYQFVVSAKVRGPRTEYTGWLFQPAARTWRKLVTFSTPAGGRALKGLYAFVEDFRRDGASTRRVRRAAYGNGWALGLDGAWRFLDRAKFTADRNPVLNIDSGAQGNRFFLATGGDTANHGTPLLGTTVLAPRTDPPALLPDLSQEALP